MKDLSKKKKIALTAVLVVLVAAGLFYITVSSTQIDPDHPNFTASDFTFRSFKDPNVLKTTLTNIFPNGTPKEYIQQILIQQAGADERLLTSNYYRYSHKAYPGKLLSVDCPAENTWTVFMKFNDQQMLTEIEKVRGPCL